MEAKNRKLALTVGASIEIAELCPEEDFANIGVLLSSEGKTYAEQTETWAKLISILSKGGAMTAVQENGGDMPEALTPEDVLSLDIADYILLRDQVLQCFDVDAAVSVRLKSQKKRTGTD